MKFRKKRFSPFLSLTDMRAGLYIHIPFCKQRCGYCSFCSSVVKDGEISRYINALKSKISFYSKKYADKEFETLYIGGGTPSLLNKENSDVLFSSLFESFNLKNLIEFTTEANPESLSEEYLESFVNHGGNRLSLGVQSLNDNECRAVSRITDKQKVFSAIKSAKDFGIKNISADLLLGLPNQNEKSLSENINVLCDLGISHLSLYSLKIDESSPLYCKKNSLSLPDEETEFLLYKAASKLLAQKGLNRYEISNFSKNGFESKHNLKYWKEEEYLGLGLSAHSFMDGVRFFETDDFNRFYSLESSVTKEEDVLFKSNSLEEKLMLLLRLSSGFPVSLFPEQKKEKLNNFHKRLISNNLAEKNSDFVILTDEGLWVMNEIILQFSRLL